jgi:hypothetical protein
VEVDDSHNDKRRWSFINLDHQLSFDCGCYGLIAFVGARESRKPPIFNDKIQWKRNKSISFKTG